MDKPKSKPRAKAAAIDALIHQGGFSGNISSNTSGTPIREPGSINTSVKNSKRRHADIFVDEKQRETQIQAAPKTPALLTAHNHSDIGSIQEIYKNLYVIDNIEQIQNLDLSKNPKVFINPKLCTVWDLHDRKLLGSPELSDIFESIRTEGQEEACFVRHCPDKTTLELIAGFRRFSVVSSISGMYLLVELHTKEVLSDRLAWVEMTRENNLDRKAAIPISAQVQSDRNAIERGIFKNLTELSLAAGKNEAWARINKNLYEQVPEEIRTLVGEKLMGTLNTPNYRKLGKIFHDKTNREARIKLILDNKDIFLNADKFPVSKIEKLCKTTSASRIRDFSNKIIKARLNENGNLSLSINRQLDEKKIKRIIKALEQELATD